MKIYIDADGCPVKEEIYRVSQRHQFDVFVVANKRINIPMNPKIQMKVVSGDPDAADNWIAENIAPKDICITADIPLADLVVQKKGIAINVRGELYTEENIRERLSVRDFMKELRDSGLETGGPASFGPKDKENFTNSLNRILTKLVK